MISCVSFIIATVSRPDRLAKCVESIRTACENTVPDYEIVIVAQGDDSGAEDLCNTFPGCKFVKISERGLSRARNAGVSNSTGEVVAFPDDDCVLSEDFGPALVRALSYPEPWEMICGAVLTEEAHEPYNRHIGGAQKDISWTSIDKVLGSAVVARRNVFDQLGGFDESLGAGMWYGGSEETDLVIRILLNGGRVLYEPALIIYHPERMLRPESTRSLGLSYGRGRGRLVRKWLHEVPLRAKIHILTSAFFRPLAGMGLATLRRNRVQLDYHIGTILGRLEGFFRPDEPTSPESRSHR